MRTRRRAQRVRPLGQEARRYEPETIARSVQQLNAAGVTWPTTQTQTTQTPARPALESTATSGPRALPVRPVRRAGADADPERTEAASSAAIAVLDAACAGYAACQDAYEAARDAEEALYAALSYVRVRPSGHRSDLRV